MSIADELTPEAVALIAEFGASVIFTPVVAGTYDPATSEAVPGGAPVAVKTVIEDTTITQNGANGNLIRVPAKRLLIAGGAIEPKPEDTFFIASKLHKVITVRSYSIGFDVVIWQVTVVAK